MSVSKRLVFGMFIFAGLGTAAWARQDAPPIPVGRVAPTVVATTVGGRDVTITFERPTVLYVLTPNCLWCIRNRANMAELFRQCKDRYAFVGLSLRKDGLKEFLEATPHPFPVHVASQDTITAYGLGVLPSTIVIERGVVTKKWNGAFNRSLPAVEEFFKVKLPGIVERLVE